MKTTASISNPIIILAMFLTICLILSNTELSFYCYKVCSFIAIMPLYLFFVFPTLNCFL